MNIKTHSTRVVVLLQHKQTFSDWRSASPLDLCFISFSILWRCLHSCFHQHNSPILCRFKSILENADSSSFGGRVMNGLRAMILYSSSDEKKCLPWQKRVDLVTFSSPGHLQRIVCFFFFQVKLKGSQKWRANQYNMVCHDTATGTVTSYLKGQFTVSLLLWICKQLTRLSIS